jgi:hypothetical protein
MIMRSRGPRFSQLLFLKAARNQALVNVLAGNGEFGWHGDIRIEGGQRILVQSLGQWMQAV